MDHPTTFSLLTWITFMPLIGAALILPVLGLRAAGALSKGAADQASRVITLVASGLTLVLALVLWKGYDPANPALQFVQHARWIPAYNIDYFVGVDGISITLVILPVLGLRAAGALSKGAADQASRVITLVASGLTLVLALVLWKGYDPANPALQFVQHARWIPAYNIDYFVGVDGISITLVIL